MNERTESIPDLTEPRFQLLSIMLNYELNPDFDKYAFYRWNFRERDMGSDGQKIGKMAPPTFEPAGENLPAYWVLKTPHLHKKYGWFQQEEIMKLYKETTEKNLTKKMIHDLRSLGILDIEYLKYGYRGKRKDPKRPLTVYRISKSITAWRTLAAKCADKQMLQEFFESDYHRTNIPAQNIVIEFNGFLNGLGEAFYEAGYSRFPTEGIWVEELLHSMGWERIRKSEIDILSAPRLFARFVREGKKVIIDINNLVELGKKIGCSPKTVGDSIILSEKSIEDPEEFIKYVHYIRDTVLDENIERFKQKASSKVDKKILDKLITEWRLEEMERLLQSQTKEQAYIFLTTPYQWNMMVKKWKLSEKEAKNIIKHLLKKYCTDDNKQNGGSSKGTSG